MDKIQDISTNFHSCLTALTAKGVTVPADASLDDLGGLIRQVPDASHPDIGLPWIMNDGESAYMFPVTVTASVSVQVDCELVPLGSSLKYITGNGGCMFGLLYTDSYVRAARQMIKDPTGGSPTLDNTNRAQTDWTGYPFYKRQTLQCSYYSSSGYRSSLLYNGSWTHAGSLQAQSSGSNYPNQPVTLFSGISFMDNAASFPFNALPAGVKVYELDRAQKDYRSTEAWSSVFTPVLHWDVNRHEYRPTFVSNGTYASFPKPGLYSDGGNAYYIDVTKGLAEKTGYSSGTRYAYTDIPNSSAYSYVLKVNCQRRNSGDAVDYITAYDTSDGYTMRIGTNISSSNYTRFAKVETYSDTTYGTYSDSIGSASYSFVLGIDFANSSMFHTFDTLTATKSDKTITKPSVSDDVRGKICLVKPHSTTYYDALYSVMVYEGSALIHYLVYCSMPGKSYGVFYDCVTKKTYDIQ